MKRSPYLAVSAALALSFGGSTAGAHGGIPRAFGIYFEPGNPDHILLRSLVWGAYHSTDGGATWSWNCSEIWGVSSTTGRHVSPVMFPGGGLAIAAQFNGLVVSPSGRFCDLAPAAEFQRDDEVGKRQELVQDVVLGLPDGSLTYALTSTGGEDGVVVQLWESTDRAASWSKLGEPLPGDGENEFTAASMAVGSDGRIYVVGKYMGVPGAILQRSDDGGQTWQSLPNIPVDGLASWSPRIHGIDPNDPDLVYVWADSLEGGGGDVKPDQLWMSTDGGGTWVRLLAFEGDMPGFTISPDGSTVAVAGPEDGFWSASTDDLRARGADALEQRSTGRFWGLTWTEAGLYAGMNDFVADSEQRFTFGVSTDGGETFSKVMTVCDPQVVACGADTLAGRVCPEQWEDYLYDMRPRCEWDLGAPADGTGGTGGAGGAGSGEDAGVGARSGSATRGVEGGKSGWCSYTVSAGRERLSAFGWTALGLGGILVARLRRRRHPRI
jgi:hypothetical protein